MEAIGDSDPQIKAEVPISRKIETISWGFSLTDGVDLQFVYF
jgi:hypothetical protein